MNKNKTNYLFSFYVSSYLLKLLIFEKKLINNEVTRFLSCSTLRDYNKEICVI